MAKQLPYTTNLNHLLQIYFFLHQAHQHISLYSFPKPNSLSSLLYLLMRLVDDRDARGMKRFYRALDLVYQFHG
ncbi:hypothetical protein P3X46_004800 [Hevea brasiliensis]|uniref:Uncharacterized protein n=1 Tax=Hevea brasiliensis TaxID=3981 RepID=A0ABQ9N1H0_HEVBR|nr:hypothetical protein P3X46_004800 [Hevea brasiliensis]